MNLFEQQAKLDAAANRAFGVNGDDVTRYVARANLAQCLSLVDALVERVSDLEGVACGLEDAAAELRRASARTRCTCGACDACIAARSDEHHDRSMDARLLQHAA